MKKSNIFKMIMLVIAAVFIFAACATTVEYTYDAPIAPSELQPNGQPAVPPREPLDIPEDGFASAVNEVGFVRDHGFILNYRHWRRAQPDFDWEDVAGNHWAWGEDDPPVYGSASIVPTLPTFGVGTGDIGITFFDPVANDGDGRMFVVFGDSWDGHFNSHSLSGRTMMSQVLLYTDNLDFTRGIEWSGGWTAANGGTLATAQEFINNSWYVGHLIGPGNAGNNPLLSPNGRTNIPTGAIAIPGESNYFSDYYIFFMEVSGDFTLGGDWPVAANRAIRSTDGGNTWHVVPGLVWTRQDAPNFGQVFPMWSNCYEWIYIYGIPQARLGSVQLGRVRPQYFDNFEKYEYFVGMIGATPQWLPGRQGLLRLRGELAETYVFDGPAGEMNVMFNDHLQRYVATYQAGATGIVMRTAPNPWGPWSAAQTLVTGEMFPRFYGAFTNRYFSANNGQTFWFLMSQWLVEPGGVNNIANVYDVRFLEVALN